MRFSRRELRDLTVAWLALGLAFTFFFAGPSILAYVPTAPGVVAVAFLGSLLTVGVGFLLHELAHKVVAVRFGQVAEFRADYGMLFLAVAGGLAGFVFAAPGAVHHRGRLTERQHGLIALAGPVTNLALAVLFLPLVVAPSAFVPPFVSSFGMRGVAVNVLLAAFNMLPFGILDGQTVWQWSRVAHLAVFLPAAGLGLYLLFG